MGASGDAGGAWEQSLVQEWESQTFWQSASVREGDGFAELPGHARHRGVQAQALLDAHAAEGHLAQILPVGTGRLSPTLSPCLCWGCLHPQPPAPEQIPCDRTENREQRDPQCPARGRTPLNSLSNH